MNNKFLIILLCCLLAVALVMGYTTITQSFDFVANKIERVGNLGQTILKISGMDFNTTVDLYVPSYDDIANGSYVNSDGEFLSIRKALNSLLPAWIYESNNEYVELYLYPTFYSADFGSQLTKWQPDFSFDPNVLDLGIFQRRVVLSSDRILRFKVNIWTLKSSDLSYDLYVFRDKVDNKYCYFVTYSNTDTGYYSTYLNSFSQFEDQTVLEKKLNSEYIEKLYDGNLATIHNYDFISNLQNTDVYLQYNFNEFIE